MVCKMYEQKHKAGLKRYVRLTRKKAINKIVHKASYTTLDRYCGIGYHVDNVVDLRN